MMFRVKKYNLVLALILLSFTGYGQEVEIDVIARDSIVPEKRVFEEKSNDPISVHYRKVPDSVVKELQKLPQFWWANEPWDKEEAAAPQKQRVIDMQWFRTLMWVLVVSAFVGAVIWYLGSVSFNPFRRKPKVIRGEGEEYVETDNIFEINYGREINRALQNGNYRLATRLMYLQLLKNLAERNIIQYKPDRTNFDYLMQLYKTPHYKEFFSLTRSYEYAWYGKFDPGKDGFASINNDFESFNRKLQLY